MSKTTVSRLIYGLVATGLATYVGLAAYEALRVGTAVTDTEATLDFKSVLFETLAGEWWGRVDHSEVLMDFHDQRGYFARVNAGHVAVARVEATDAGVFGTVKLRLTTPHGAGDATDCLVRFGDSYDSITVERIEPAAPWPERPFLMNRIAGPVESRQLDHLRQVLNEVAEQDREDAR